MADITIEPDAAERLAELERLRGELAFKIDNGCCGGTTLLLIEGRFVGSNDVQVGEAAGVPVYAEHAFTEVYAHDRYHIYARTGRRDGGFSVEIPYGFRFLMERECRSRAEGT
jgi:uncharacterized protein (DUF779 family)